jgi:integrase
MTDPLEIMMAAHGGDEESGGFATDGNAARKLLSMPKPKKERKQRSRMRGQGTLFLRGTTFWMELHWKGQRYRQSLATADRQTALSKMDERIRVIRSGEEPLKFEPITVQAMFDLWITEVERTCSTRTLEDYKSRWNAHLKACFGGMFATQVTRDKISTYLTNRKKEGAGEITQNRENRVLQMIFGFNRKKMSADRFPEFPKMHSEKNRVHKGRLSDADYQTLLTKLDDPKLFWLKSILTLTFKFGFRKSELLKARVSYFDAKASVFTLPAYTTKNKAERRVPIKRDGDIYKMLVKLAEGRNPEDALFHRNGRPVKDYRRTWETLTEGMDNGRGEHVAIHDLRRSAITSMSQKGIGAEKAGTHLTADVFRRYIVQSEEEEQAIAAAIEE